MKRLLLVFCLLPQIAFGYKIHFLGSPCIKPSLASDQFNLCGDFHVAANDLLYIVPKGFETDLASIPWPVRAIYSPASGKAARSVILHDYFYRIGNLVSRKEADDILYYSLIEDGLSSFTAYQYWSGTRLFGWMAFNERS